MEGVFLRVINMSITASYVIAVVLAVRWLLARAGAPKKLAYMLWTVVGIRLCCPVSFETAWSLFSAGPLKAPVTVTGSSGGEYQRTVLDFVPEDIGMMSQPAVETGVPVLNEAINGSLPAAVSESSVNPMQIWLAVGTAVWVIGIAALLVYSVVSYVRLRRRLSHAVLHENNVWLSEFACSPFIFGFAKPRIYIPYGLEPQTLEYVLAHENCHLKRGDHIIKMLAFMILAVHWFNPLCWLAFSLMGRDMEMSCDEKVLLQMGGISDKKDYSLSLLNFAAGRRFSMTGPLAFGETSVKTRIRNILGWKRPRVWVTAIALIICLAAGAVCLANPMAGKRAVARVLGEDVSAELIEYVVKYQQHEGSENPLEDALDAVKVAMRNEYVVRNYSEVYDQAYFDRLIEEYVETSIEELGEISAETKQEFVTEKGITIDKWKETILPEYEAPLAVYSQYILSSGLVTKIDEGLKNIDAVELEILDPAFMSLMAEKYPCTRDLSRDFIDELVPEFEAQYGTTGTEIYSWYRYDYGRRAIVYGRTFYGGKEYEGEAYLHMTEGNWKIEELKIFEGFKVRQKDAHERIEYMNGNQTSYFLNNFDFFPEFRSTCWGTMDIGEGEAGNLLIVNINNSYLLDDGGSEGPSIKFTVCLYDDGSAEVVAKNLQEYVSYGPVRLTEFKDSYYVIPDERLIHMAKELYEYVPANATVQG